MTKRFLAAAVSGSLLFLCATAAAQKQEVSLSVSGGPSGLDYPIKNGTRSLSTGFGAGLGYSRFFNPRWGIATGLELGYYRTKTQLDPNTVFPSYEVDSEGSAFEYRVQTKGYQEAQSLPALHIPLLVQYQSLPKRQLQFYSLAGIKLSLPLGNRYSARSDEIRAAGYYPDLNVEISDLPVHGFGSQINWAQKGSYDFRIAAVLTAEGGAKIRLSSRSFLYAGAFIDYGLNDLKKEQGHASLLAYNPAGLSRSVATGVFSLAGTTGNVHLLAYGLKLRLAFSLGKPQKAAALPGTAAPTPALPEVPVKTEEKPFRDTVAEPAAADTLALKEGAILTLTEADEAFLRIPFRFNQLGNTALSATAKVQADQLAALLQRYPDLQVQIEGHTCNLGSEAVNRRVALSRARTVAAYLQEKGIHAARMQVVSKGAAEPLVPNTSEANRKQNRRVVIQVIEP